MSDQFDCTDIQLRMHFAIHGGLDEEETEHFFGHLAGCHGCRILFLSMSLTEEPLATENASADTDAVVDSDTVSTADADADAVPTSDATADDDAVHGYPVAPPIDFGIRPHPWTRTLVAAAVTGLCCLVVGIIAGAFFLGTRFAEPERMVVIPDESVQNDLELARNEIQNLMARITTLTDERDAARAQLAAGARPTVEVSELATQLDAARTLIAQLEQKDETLRQENATLRARLAKLRAGDGATLNAAAVCQPGSVQMEFETKESWPACGEPSKAAYTDKASKRVYWTVTHQGDLKSCMCTAAQ